MFIKKINHVARGITVIEVMITLSVTAILMAIAAPSFNSWIRNTEIRSTAESLRAALQKARAEAISRNARVKLKLTDSNGIPNWTISCARVTSICPAEIKRQYASGNSEVRIGISKNQNALSTNTAIASGTLLPAEITFSAIGTAPNITNDTDIARIDISQLNNQTSLRLVLLISTMGAIKLCNPSVVSPNPETC